MNAILARHRAWLAAPLVALALTACAANPFTQTAVSPSPVSPPRCVQLVAAQTMTSSVVDGAYECTSGKFRSILDSLGVQNDQGMAAASPAAGAGQFEAASGNLYFYMLGDTAYAFEVDSNGRVDALH